MFIPTELSPWRNRPEKKANIDIPSPFDRIGAARSRRELWRGSRLSSLQLSNRRRGELATAILEIRNPQSDRLRLDFPQRPKFGLRIAQRLLYRLEGSPTARQSMGGSASHPQCYALRVVC